MKFRLLALPLAMLGCCAGLAQAAPEVDEASWFTDTYKELIEINTTYSVGNTTDAAKAMQKRLLDAGLPAADIEVLEPFPKRGNLLARYRGTGAKKPLLLLAHIDVVEAKKEEWKTDPFKLQEQNGYYIARGAIDDKAMASAYVSALGQLKREGFVPNRDIVLALTSDEERDVPSNGAAWLIKNRRSDVDAELGINEGGRGELKGGKPSVHVMQIGEKTYLDYAFEATGPGGHSARPTPDNTIYDLADALTRLRQYRFPVQLSEATRVYFERSAPFQEHALAADFREVATGKPSQAAIDRLSNRSSIVGLLRSTCVATQVEAGHAPNALAQRAKATVNCRALPGDDIAAIKAKLDEIAGPKVKVSPIELSDSAPASPLNPAFMGVVERISEAMWPGVPVIPTMGVSTTDSYRFRAAGIPMYGVSGLFVDPEKTGVHGLNENIGVQQLKDGREFMYRLIKGLASNP
ncbi:M20/M25/M40 family metallo-hydrolase [Variovorax rhizosphaerae]|uniref:M20/M25/M40 family metallo-hydrolase n=1 Tax=Variovorax rhizosphaerae TaxID=1836200 RepID=A0ABU8WHE3_9BURK